MKRIVFCDDSYCTHTILLTFDAPHSTVSAGRRLFCFPYKNIYYFSRRKEQVQYKIQERLLQKVSQSKGLLSGKTG
jgi:hypothetical protein